MVLRFRCLHCLHCCFFSTPVDYPIVLEGEVDTLKKLALERNITLNFRRITDQFYLWIIEGFCPFYDIANRRCSIHENKPFSCKMFPLLLNIRTGEVSVSFACDWVINHISELINERNNIAEIFPDEFKAVVNLFKKIKALRSGE
ncbi:MAG: YkgJ family cysteine cluster protein [Desulfurococcales archaeon]|nr:YkgJ family cysteine cluster protein [Desulfurococcales archaeon]RLG78403.1 MAG: YkgJ family cysteine cluster protein [Thermoprotei archaeon]